MPWAIVAIAMMLALAVLIYLLGRTVLTEEWSHPEMIQYLRDRGLKFSVSDTHPRGAEGPAMNFELDDGGRVFVQMRKTPKLAEAAAAANQDKAFAWRRFYFEGDPRELAKIRHLLP